MPFEIKKIANNDDIVMSFLGSEETTIKDLGDMAVLFTSKHYSNSGIKKKFYILSDVKEIFKYIDTLASKHIFFEHAYDY